MTALPFCRLPSFLRGARERPSTRCHGRARPRRRRCPQSCPKGPCVSKMPQGGAQLRVGARCKAKRPKRDDASIRACSLCTSVMSGNPSNWCQRKRPSNPALENPRVNEPNHAANEVVPQHLLLVLRNGTANEALRHLESLSFTSSDFVLSTLARLSARLNLLSHRRHASAVDWNLTLPIVWRGTNVYPAPVHVDMDVQHHADVLREAVALRVLGPTVENDNSPRHR